MAARLAVLCVLGIAWLPTAHVHRGALHDDDHPAEVVHRHLTPHQAFSSTDGVQHVDHPDDGDALYINDVFVASQSTQLVPSRHLLAVVVDSLSVVSTAAAHRPLSTQALRTHDPPWRSSSALRGPPLQLA
jgi:hypothetical protein